MAEIINSNHKSPDEFYKSLHEKLTDHHNFPEEYLYKFIIPSDSGKITEILKVFDGLKFTFSNRESKNGNYTACTIQCFVLDADQVINIYKKVAEIEGVVML
ncbi:DUF493 domain-containing protein [Chryseobacterium sp. POL2]|uniref:DUF493 family protein n=1 Tax=Chryseobacterium sp. POL2 TaxID=2713414 RepID=UPI0013E1CB01|nr:DUF493 family protein [Chryseobacterium sp. POL2]QIG89123.1 DUF493 domain-containing protein [Chryseobacterium sp. POL2]